MNKLMTLALASIGMNLLLGCIGDNEKPPIDDAMDPAPIVEPTPIEFPRTCAEASVGHLHLLDGYRTLYVSGDQAKPWPAWCVDMQTKNPAEYLTLPDQQLNWSQYQSGAASPGTNVETRFQKVRVDGKTMKVDIGDHRFATSTGSLKHLGAGEDVTAMPWGIAMTCDAGNTAVGAISTDGTPFNLANDFELEGDLLSRDGHSNIWFTNQTVEFWAHGNCGWIAPKGSGVDPMMNDAGDYLIQLTYQ